ncbi:phage tail tube protein [Pseudostreptobacillus hongkongensis]|uniref:phage tail tube protein n=1 Tax=Pseudostreptobacillus hongkongensis TaxID=1162717 RepID=UPI00082A9C35|nr:phage tail tube protein [Pseudostreptobacillus hongkongensis]
MAINKGDRQAISTKYGEIFINNERVQEVVSAEIKVSVEYGDIEVAGDPSKYRKYLGNEVSGTITIKKIDSKFSKIISEMIKNRYAPEINAQFVLSDNAFSGSEAVALYGVTFDEILLMKIQSGETFEQEIPFKAESFEMLEYME